MGFDAYRSRFGFRTEGAFLVGVERECFLTDASGAIAPLAPRVLAYLTDPVQFGYELSACQLETRVGPCRPSELAAALAANDAQVAAAERALGFGRLHREVGPADIPLDVYPDPTGRYAQIVKTLPLEVLRAACRVIGTHVHIGMPDHDVALAAYNHATAYLDELCALGDGSGGERLGIYAVMAPQWRPPRFDSWQDFYEAAVANGFDADPRKCWTLIRISVHGTIEFRMFGATGDLNRIVGWAKRCHEICAQVLR